MTVSIGIVVDSACDVPPDWRYRHRVHVIPLHIIFGEEDFLDGVEMSQESFYQRIQETGVIPTTSQPSPGEFAALYRQLSHRYDAIISIHLGAKLSGAYQSAVLGAHMAADEITVYPFDSGGGSAGAGFMADEAMRMIDAGAAPEAILRRLELLRERIRIFLTPRDLRFPRMSGRVNALSAFVASVLHITPIVVLVDGELAASERARSRKQAIRKIVKMAREETGDGPVNIAIVHSRAPADVAFFKQTILSTFQPQKFWIARLSSPVAAHLGPGTIGIVCYRID